MMELLINYLAMLFVSIAVLYIFKNLYYSKKVKELQYFIICFITSMLLTLLFLYVGPVLRMLIIVLLYVFISYFFFSNNVKDAIVDALFIESICIISEIVYTLFFLILNTNENIMVWNHSVIGTVLSNIIIPVIMILIFKIRIIRKLYVKFKEYTNFLTKKHFLFSIIFFYVISIMLFYSVYYTYYSNKVILFITISIVFLLYTIIFYLIMETSSKYENIKSKYSLSIENLKSYESMLDQYRISNHENKNQLLLIRNMIKDKKTKNYIDELIDNKEKDDSNVYNKLKRIPSSSIRAVIYSKVLLMNNKNINYSIDIDRKLSSKDFSNISSNLSLDICNILNIFIDNAIDEVGKSKNKQILIEFNKDSGSIEIAVSNTCDKDIKLNEIYGMGYSTKGDGHGYGLSLAKNILDKNSSKLSNKTEMVNDIFTQYLYVKIK